jgi:type IV pilus assembly protein PilQ
MTGRAGGFEQGHRSKARSRSLALLAGPIATACLALAALLVGPSHARAQQTPAEAPAAQRAVVRWKEILTEGDVTRVRLETSSLPRYRVSATAQPPAAEVELFDVEMEGLPAQVEVKDGTIDLVETRALPGGAGRLTFRLMGPGEAQVVPWGGGLDILVHLAGSAAEASVTRSEGERLARRLTGPDGLSFSLGAAPTNLSAFLLSDGKRLVVDAEGVEIPSAQVTEEFSEGPFARVRAARQDGRIRAVIEAREAGIFEGHRLEKTAEGFNVLLAGSAPAAKPAAGAATSAPAEAKAAAVAAAPAEAKAAKAEAPDAEPRGGGSVLDLGFRQEGGRSLVEIVVSKSAPHVVRQASAQRVVVDVLKTTLPDKFKRALDTTAFPGPVRLIAAYPRGGAGGRPTDTRIVVDLRKPAPYRIERQGGRITLVFEGGAPEPAVPGVAEVRKGEEEVVVVEGKPAAGPEKGAPGAAPKVAATKAEAAKAEAGPAGYTGRRLSMDFMDADIRNVLRLIGEVSGLNMVTGDDVQGKVTIRLVDVPWDQALDVILKTKGLGLVREGNVMRIAPADKLAAEKARVQEAEKGAEEKAPLVSDILPVNYASAKEIVDKIKAVLTPRGSVTVDDRTNALLVKDVTEKVQEARALIARLDTPTPQVLIEARIVEVTSNVDKSLGIQWGGKYTADTAHGNATDWAFPNSIGINGSTTPANNFAVNLPAAVDTAGALSLTFGHVNDILRLDLRLSALESANQVRVVSSPRVTTLDNRTAEISQGEEIPFTTSTQEKIETKSIDYKMTLNVTPHVTSDRSIIMKIDLKKDSVGGRTAADGKTPSKDTKSATTELLVKDGETTVIGGIITDDQRNFKSGIPFFSKLPFVGWLFKNSRDTGAKTELVIFITPKIVTPTAVVGSL